MAQSLNHDGPGDVTFAEGEVQADGLRIRYAAAGQGPAVVMLAGSGGLSWSRVHQALAKKYRVTALELPGFGPSLPNHRSQSVQDLAQTMARATASLGVETYSLVGASFGARVALWQALQWPQRVELLLLVAPTAVLPEGYTLPPGGVANETVQERALVQRLNGNSRDTELEGRLAEVQPLTLVVFGVRDQVVAPAMGRTYRERIPNCHYVLVYDAGHAVAEERPEALINTLTDFLDLRETFIVGRRDGRINP